MYNLNMKIVSRASLLGKKTEGILGHLRLTWGQILLTEQDENIV